MEEPARPREGVTAKGLPFSQRGGLVADFAAVRIAGADSPFAAIDVIAHIPIADRTFFDAVLPIGFGAIGNPMVGAHHVFRPADPVWITLGGALGVPLINAQGFETFQVARAFWDLEEFARSTIPYTARFGVEGHAGLFELRGEIDAVWGISTKSSVHHLFAWQHAAEMQIGHAIGGGVRYQGMFFATDTIANGNGGFDKYQGALELFFRLVRDPIFARVGFVLPLDSPLGYQDGGRSWGVHAQTGFNID